MFDLSFEKILVLLAVALFILGPERLPAAAAWLGGTIRKVKEFAGDTQQRLRDEMGPEFDQLREPLAQLQAPLQELRGLRDPRTAALRFLTADPAAPHPVTAVTAGPPTPPRLEPGERPPVDPDAT